ncbi:2-hydroxymuconic semialdehyde dehydrogenase [Persicimonas caeni]|uniref:2-hydroxymuconic semialdehyde dehydrogenase n=1 Tax=Persicimonas caeni TaxID=2292766 RepID=A0A4Y6PTE5_PERCE|nr:2-hydroxymuconic semialdehyde dehydrogenase [Persicimonas caeni]QDG51592.1 2-hydroxymuconic semialdehyde dehydrogenase [Persicimonas caeni]QED32813.1 2-hydroxymuconic semialdehyde dehydrogenase [Persicimonas caeni]
MFKHFINGEFVPSTSGRTFDNINPVTGELVGKVAEGGEEEVDRAVAAAQRALEGPWGTMPRLERLDLLEKVAEGIEARFDDFLAAEIADTGKPKRFASKVDIPRGAANLKFFANLARNLESQSYTMDTSDGGKALSYVLREPVGVVGVISPWNLPLLLLTWKLGPALAMGNTVVVKPSEETPGTATLLGEVFDEVGVPPGVYNVVNGLGPNSAGEAITRHPGISAITFTGESRTGQIIQKASAESLKSLSFELGGKNPALIFADCDFDAAVAGTTRSVFANCGQVCLCSERVYVERPIFDDFVAALKEKAEDLKMGDPFDEATGFGPLISEEHRQKVLSYYELAREEGATVVTGGGIPELDAPYSNGFYVEPTIWTGLADDARCMREEVFGPVCHIRPFDTDDEAIALANDSDYGLAAAIWTQNLERAHKVAARVETGMVWLNTWFLRDLRTPFGGVKLSGVGREGGMHSLDFYSELKTVCTKL